jgi:hypothetical protein
MRRAGHAVRTGEKRNRHNVLVKKPEGKRQTAKTWSRREDNAATTDLLIALFLHFLYY